MICSPGSFKSTWIPDDEIPAEGVAAADITDISNMSPEQQYDSISVDYVWKKLVVFIDKYIEKAKV